MSVVLMVMIISGNPLFKEVILQAAAPLCSQCLALEYAKTDFYQGFLRLCRGALDGTKPAFPSELPDK